MSISNSFNNLKNSMYKNFGSNPAKMLIWTGVIGWFLSAAAQVFAIAVNDEIPKEQKAFLIPQEIADGAVNVLSFFVITNSVKALASKLVSSGKIATPKIRKFLDAKNIKLEADVDVRNLVKNANHLDLLDNYDKFKKGFDVAGMTVGSVLSCNIVTPIIRNKFASKRQHVALAKMETERYNYLYRPSMQQFFSSNSLKI